LLLLESNDAPLGRASGWGFKADKKLRGKSLGIEILIKSVLYFGAWYLVVLIGYGIGTHIEAQFVDSPLVKYTEVFTGNVFYASSIYTAIMIIIISFIKQMNAKFGPGILIPMFLGKFRHPRIEKRIFLFMDLKDSTSYAEKLGNLKFSELIQDCFNDANKVIPPFNAEIYQYVGDEVVLTDRNLLLLESNDARLGRDSGWGFIKSQDLTSFCPDVFLPDVFLPF
jgi:adenylate cyclase